MFLDQLFIVKKRQIIFVQGLFHQKLTHGKCGEVFFSLFKETQLVASIVKNTNIGKVR